MFKNKKGFTLIELLIVIAIIGVLSSIVLTNLNNARAKSRDAKRKVDMTSIQTALEAYHNDFGAYPARAAWGVYMGNCGSSNPSDLSGPGGYIPNLAPTYIAQLPVDPSNIFGGCTGYLYYSNGTDYVLLDHGAPESYPPAGTKFYDPQRPTWSWKLCNDKSSAFCAN